MNKKGHILIIDDNEDVLFALNVLLMPYMKKIKVTTQPERIIRFMDDFHPDVILLDMNFQKDVVSGKEGFYWLEKILNHNPESIVLLMTAYADTEKAVQAIKSGATDFIPKPWAKEKLLATISSAIKLKESRKEVAILKNKMQLLRSAERASEIIGESDAMQAVFTLIDRLANTEANILLLGENGTGKDLIARTIHDLSPRSNEVFTSIDLGSISESLFESELFGYEKGAFTDARKAKEGRMEIALGGTLFLNEIGNLSLPMQAKMLTAIEKKQICRLGSNLGTSIDVRFISATNTDLRQAVEDGLFRQDLLYRINTIELIIPPLRERGYDIILLAEHFLTKLNSKYKKMITGISNNGKQKLLKYHWPGNVRELQNIVERAVILSTNRQLQADDFVLLSERAYRGKIEETLNLEKLEQTAIEKALDISNGNMNKAAEILGISRFSLYRKINKK